MIKAALDISNFSGTLSPEQAQAIAEFCDRVVIGLQDTAIALQQYDALQAAGVPQLDAYQYFYFTGNPQDWHTRTTAALDSLGGRVIEKFWIDCEDDSAANFTALENQTAIAMAASACEGRVFSGIYTRRDWWEQRLANSDAFKDYPLWNCTVRGSGVRDIIPPGYGGWLSAEMEQIFFSAPDLSVPVNADTDIYEDGSPNPNPALGYADGYARALTDMQAALNGLHP